ncbi:Longin-like domain [Pseudocohnilembus persalinus]|uniref:Coatomer subunit zeta n=1 Tax=Pseudocohnilembus persalinus TaxID=266149 RepID=A0A0V0R0V8_PSEPJ|nr:Longin-like domain [Pseudocohnilembus persalinus]|eukprot:KRX08169.1 Longin-like domain [Pseudocohnilembus persalinus]
MIFQKLSGNICKVLGIVVLRNDGSRIYSKYYTKVYPQHVLKTQEGTLDNIETQKAFEKNMVEKSQKLTGSKPMTSTQAEIFSLGQFNIVFKILSDVFIYVIGDSEENQVILSNVLQSLNDGLDYFTKDKISKKTVIEQYQNLILLIDEMIDEGIIVTLEVESLIARCTMNNCDKINLSGEPQQQSQSSSAFSSVFASAKNSIAKNWNF